MSDLSKHTTNLVTTDRWRLSVQWGGGSPHRHLLHVAPLSQGAGGDLPPPPVQPRPGADRVDLGLRPVLLPAPAGLEGGGEWEQPDSLPLILGTDWSTPSLRFTPGYGVNLSAQEYCIAPPSASSHRIQEGKNNN